MSAAIKSELLSKVTRELLVVQHRTWKVRGRRRTHRITRGSVAGLNTDRRGRARSEDDLWFRMLGNPRIASTMILKEARVEIPGPLRTLVVGKPCTFGASMKLDFLERMYS